MKIFYLEGSDGHTTCLTNLLLQVFWEGKVWWQMHTFRQVGVFPAISPCQTFPAMR